MEVVLIQRQAQFSIALHASPPLPGSGVTQIDDKSHDFNFWMDDIFLKGWGERLYQSQFVDYNHCLTLYAR